MLWWNPGNPGFWCSYRIPTRTFNGYFMVVAEPIGLEQFGIHVRWLTLTQRHHFSMVLTGFFSISFWNDGCFTSGWTPVGLSPPCVVDQRLANSPGVYRDLGEPKHGPCLPDDQPGAGAQGGAAPHFSGIFLWWWFFFLMSIVKKIVIRYYYLFGKSKFRESGYVSPYFCRGFHQVYMEVSEDVGYP